MKFISLAEIDNSNKCMKEEAGTIHGTPKKRLFLAIIADYDLNLSICELIDNALDNWGINRSRRKLCKDITIDTIQQSIEIKDNSGGIPEEQLKSIISPGETTNDPNSRVIGIFGVGSKRAVIALSKDIKIISRHGTNATYLVEFDDSWLNENDDWDLRYYKVDDISPSTTCIKLQALRFGITGEMVDRLKKHLQATYARFLINKKLEIRLNAPDTIQPILFENWSYPPRYKPVSYSGKITCEEGSINVEIIAGLSRESSPATGEYGVYFYCNRRLVARGLKTFEVGFGSGLAGKPHPIMSLVRVIVCLDGGARLMPWNSSKSNVSYEHKIFQQLRDNLIKIVKHYAKISKGLSATEGGWPKNVFRYSTGRIKDEKIDFGGMPRLHLPPAPKSKPRIADRLKHDNKRILDSKPWAKGLLGGVIASDIIFKQKFDEKNRIALIVLDSTLEIAFKEFLVKESGTHYSDQQLLTIFRQRHQVEGEIRKYPKGNRITASEWRLIGHYYDVRCKLVHQRASINIIDEDIVQYTNLVEKIVGMLFGVKFN